MTSNQKVACVFGGTGFLGRQVVRELAKAGYTVKVATRFPESAYFLKPCGTVGQVVPFKCNYADEESVRTAVKGSCSVVNLIGILYERGKRSSFKRAHIEIPTAIAKACAEEKVDRFVHISALGIDEANSKYAKSKKAGEEAVSEAFPQATILRPSVMFGPGDGFFNMFARMAQVLPALPLIGGGKTKFQPVYVGDVADAAMAAITKPASGESNPKGKTYSLGGPEVLSFEEIYKVLFDEIGRSRKLVNLPWPVAKLQGTFLGMLPRPPLTRDQVCSLKTDNIVPEGAPGLADLGVEPTGMAAILPSYLACYRPGGRFGGKNAA